MSAMEAFRYNCSIIDGTTRTQEICLSLGAVNRSRVANDECTKGHTFDYFIGSELSFIVTLAGIGLFAIGCILTLKILAERRNSLEEKARKKKSRKQRMSLSEDITLGNQLFWKFGTNFGDVFSSRVCQR